jgi:oxalate decarboxylase/phosphoglucose isomerase-like protein (cupin superfamily)
MHIRPDDVSTMSFDWGTIKWLVTPSNVPGVGSTQGEVVVNPGYGHARHLHQSEELIYIVSGEAEQMVDDGEPFVIKAGDMVQIPARVYHSTRNLTWRPLHMIITYTPGGEEESLKESPDFRLYPPAVTPEWVRTAAAS